MSRVAKKPVTIPAAVDVKISGDAIEIKGAKGVLQSVIHNAVEIKQEDGALTFAARGGSKEANAMAGTTRALVSNMVTGVTEGFVKKLTLVGVGYRAQMQGKSLNLTLGFSHPVNYLIPDGITVEMPSTRNSDSIFVKIRPRACCSNCRMDNWMFCCSPRKLSWATWRQYRCSAMHSCWPRL